MTAIYDRYGNDRLAIMVGQSCFRFEGLDAVCKERLSERYGPFVAERENADHVVDVLMGDDCYLADDTGFLKLEEKIENGRKVLLSTNFKGFDIDAEGKGKILVSPQSGMNAFLTALENYFRWIVSYELVKRGGFLLHSSGIIKEGGAHLFFGNSGDGKSTIASFSESRGAKILSDDLVVVFPKEGGFHAFGAPFFGVLPQASKERSDFPVKACYRIRKSSETKLNPISKGEAIGLMIPSCLYINDQKTRNEMLLPAVMRFLESVMFYELLFRKDDAFWELL